mmetsp:Transcript_22137/g.76059  ORF Transcript_22137/g.76059 Transcript_22137/m.76059 type:complete len:249 (+) Transcript_22137:121-867(+)
MALQHASWWYALNPDPKFVARFPNTSWAEALGMKLHDFHACALEAKRPGPRREEGFRGARRVRQDQQGRVRDRGAAPISGLPFAGYDHVGVPADVGAFSANGAGRSVARLARQGQAAVGVQEGRRGRAGRGRRQAGDARRRDRRQNDQDHGAARAEDGRGRRRNRGGRRLGQGRCRPMRLPLGRVRRRARQSVPLQREAARHVRRRRHAGRFQAARARDRQEARLPLAPPRHRARARAPVAHARLRGG